MTTHKVFCETCRSVFNEETHREQCPHEKIGDVVLAVRADGKSAAVASKEVIRYMGAKDPTGSKAELRLVIHREDGVIPDQIIVQHGTVFATSTGQRFTAWVPWRARFRAWLRRVFRRNR